MASLITEAQREAFVRRVRLAMAKSGLTREVLAQKAGIKERTLGNLLAGEAVRDATVAKVAEVLGIDIDAVFGAEPAEAGGAGNDGRAGEAYGVCLLPIDGGIHAFSVLKHGRVEEVAIDIVGETVSCRTLRGMTLSTRTEGCVADPRDGTLYFR